MEIKRFSTPDPTVGDPVPFEVEVVRVRTKTVHPDVEEGQPAPEPREETYHERETLTFAARPDVSGGVLLQVEMMGGLGGNRKNARGADALMDFYDAALMPADGSFVADDGQRVEYLGQAEFRKMVDDPDTHVHIDVLIDLAQWLYGRYADNRPTRPRRR